MSLNGRVPLSATDLLGLAEQRKVARVDLDEAGYSGVVYVCDLTAAQQQKILSAPLRGKKIRQNTRDNWQEFDAGDLLSDAGAKFLESCLVTDKDGGAILERAFDAAGEDAEYIIFPASELITMFELMVKETNTPSKAREKLEAFPNAVTSLVAKTVREISGMANEDRVEEKKDNS